MAKKPSIPIEPVEPIFQVGSFTVTPKLETLDDVTYRGLRIKLSFRENYLTTSLDTYEALALRNAIDRWLAEGSPVP